VLDSAPENRASEDDAAVLEKRFQICQDGGLCRWFGGGAVEDPVQGGRGETGVSEVERLEHARLDDSRRVALQAPRRLVQAGVVRVEKRDQRPLDRKAAAVQEKAGADADVEMRAADVSVVEVEEVPPWAPPDEAAREPQDDLVVEREPRRCVNGNARMGLGRRRHGAGGFIARQQLGHQSASSRASRGAGGPESSPGRKSEIATAIGGARIPTIARAICAASPPSPSGSSGTKNTANTTATPTRKIFSCLSSWPCERRVRTTTDASDPAAARNKRRS